MIWGKPHMTRDEFLAWETEMWEWKPLFASVPHQLTDGRNKGRWVWLQEIERRQFIGEGGIYSCYRLCGD